MVLTTIVLCLGVVFARDHSFDIYEEQNNGSIWSFDDDLKPYEHPWSEIPDLINMTRWQFRFDMAHHFLTGVERGMYGDDEIDLHPLCFGERYVIKLNQLRAILNSGFISNFVPFVSLIYQFYYMLGDQCSWDRLMNEFFIFCWNHGCYPKEML